MTKRNAVPWWTMSVLALGVVACVCGNLGNITELVENTTTDGGEINGASAGDFTEIEPNQSHNVSMPSTDEDYPANCQYFSLDIPDGSSNLEINVTDMSTDLDLYVQYDNPDFASEFNSDGEGIWGSRAEGNEDEQVSISSPEGGTYYIEVCSYEGNATDYTFSTSLR